MKLIELFGEFATEYRGWFVLIFVLPFSVLYDIYFSLRSNVIQYFHSAPKLHKQRILKIQKEIKEFNKSNSTKKLCTARGGWQSISPSLRSYKEKSKGISINLYDILAFDQAKMTVTVEPMVNMGQLSKFLIPKGYSIPVLPEMDDLTCGGLLMGVGIETSSHKYGLFNDSVVEAEIITSNGELVTCSKTQNRELFDALPWSYGTLGFLASMKIRVIKVQPFVKMWYVPTYTEGNCSKVFKAAAHKKKKDAKSWKDLKDLPGSDYLFDSAAQHEFDFVESLMYSPVKMVTMPAKFVPESQVTWSKTNRIGLWFKPWFFKHVASFLAPFGTGELNDGDIAKEFETNDNIESFLDANFTFEYIPLRDYYHRHTKSIFWELEEIIPFGNHPIVRYLLGWALPPKVSFLKVTQTAKIKEIYEKNHVIQDMMVPESTMDASLDVFDRNYGIYPLWVCPYRAYDYSKLSKLAENGANVPHRCFLKAPENLVEDEAYELYVDLGAYGVPNAVKEKKPFDIVKISRNVEQFVHSVHGFQMLYATSYQEREEFREMFDHRFYDEMKKRYDPNNKFPQVFDKVCKNASKVWESQDSKKEK